MILVRLLLLALLVTACTTPPVRQGGDPLPLVAETDRWHLFGRIALTRGESGWHASVDWQERPDSFRLRVTGPFGQGAVDIVGKDGHVALRDANGRIHAADSLDALLLQVTGWELPVEGMRYWARGIADPATESLAQYDSEGRLEQLQQNGWTIEYRRYHEATGGQWPARLRLVRGDVSVRLVVDRWQLGYPPVHVP